MSVRHGDSHNSEASLGYMMNSGKPRLPSGDLVSRRKKGEREEREKERGRGGREEDFKISYADPGHAFQV